MRVLLGALVGSLALLYASPVAGGDWRLEVDPNITEYEKVSGISGHITSAGSDTLNNLMALWSEAFRDHYPSVSVQVEGKGSSTAPPGLINGTAQLGPMSRPMKTEEIEAFEREKGYKPTSIAVALDAVAIYVNKDNPIESLTLPEVDALFSKTRKGGYGSDVVTWGQLRADSPLADYPISLYGRNSASGTYGYFKHYALFKGDYKDKVKEQPGSSSVVMSVTEDLAGIGYSGIGYMTSGVKTVPISRREGLPAVEAMPENVLDGSYPLGRLLLIYIDKKPHIPLPNVVRELLLFVLSREGQEIVVKSGYIPLPARLVERQYELLK